MTHPDLIWIVEDDKSIRWVLEKALHQARLSVRSFDSAHSALEQLDRADPLPAVILSDIRMPGLDGFELLAQLQQRCPQVPVIIMTAHSDLDSAVQSYQGGAFEYLPKPFDLDDAVALIQRALTHARKNARSAGNRAPGFADLAQADGLIGEAPAMQEVFRAIGRLSQSHISVLINGESGTGKELVAQALHRHSPRSSGPFVALNMAAIPRDLIESELFGHEKGAFTGAASQRQGRFEQASGGTLFLDEIGDMPLDAQTRLLRVLSDGSFYRVGGTTSIRADVRIIAATHQDLEALAHQGRFREDLFYRLNVIRIRLPKLSERREDIPRLAAFFLQKAAHDFNTEARALHPDAARYLTELDWPGNVRQLENVCRWLTVMAASREVLVSDLPAELLAARTAPQNSADHSWETALAQWASDALAGGQHDLLGQALPRFERIMLTTALNHSAGRRNQAAELLGWGRNTLTRKLKELDLQHSFGADDGEG
ncbi:nitrogen regulation protein NR(I) [Sinimarinibacterium sp. NLF-5-8]|uniref:nitrogen regulation protein NR(I) n=1 Tax=Sinimarinibacterium sp. NLF-5-8 TaxID=2698684 RepID=UPI00137BE815|nr:nitrogen regulation protein NR(I) [Sinimarinibacterium sp. NLF-5-8]QHS11428.1 nitrogen regulation protein NR(I) [Sinimarinibacterium sp. NLF-5-8]